MTIEEKLHKKIDWMSVKHIAVDVIIQDIVSICKQEIEQAEIRGWNKCYKTYIEDNDDDTALTNKQEIAEADNLLREILALWTRNDWGYNSTIKERVEKHLAPLDEVK